MAQHARLVTDFDDLVLHRSKQAGRIAQPFPNRSLASLYAGAGVEEYWIVLPVERRVEVHRRPQDGSYLDHAVVEGDTVLACGSLPTIRVSLAELFD